MIKYSEELEKKLQTAFANKGDAYQARTRYLDDDQHPKYINRLILGDSPYLLQHAHNPVDWYPWGEEAFEKAKQKNKPVFLSIGYSTCHWCHVMEEESFDNEDIAKRMNESFICIKVDRELHPDVDTFYMTAVMMMQGQGGWPMSSFLTPDRKPFFGGTYFQPAQFIALINRVNDVWLNQQSKILEQATSISQQVSDAMEAKQSLNEIGNNVIDLTAQSIMNQYDQRHGGFGHAPKFPNEPYLHFLLEYAIYSENTEILDAVTNTLQIQSCGGLYDQIAGGFHRYATDPDWLIPHFEKMLYNQANLSYVFAHAHMLTGKPDFKRIACETLDYILHEMTNDGGGFYSATDADSEGKEGLFFTWDKKEIESILSENDAKEFIGLYRVTNTGNFEGSNILNLSQSLEETAKKNYIDYDSFVKRLSKNKKILLESRNKRIPPIRDNKIITAWNAMMIKSLSYIGQQFNQQHYIDVAIKATTYILNTNKNHDDQLSRSSLSGQASIPALQEDYAYLAEALLQLYDATLNKHWLDTASTLTNEMIDRFWDEANGGFFMNAQDKKNLLPVSPKEINDNATSSGNSVALRVLVKLARRTNTQRYQTYAQQLIRTYSDDITQRPYICSYFMCGLLEMFIGEQSDYQWCAEGNIHLSTKHKKENNNLDVTLEINVANGWHLNEIQDMNNSFVPIKIECLSNWNLGDISYPTSITKKLDFQSEALNIYEDVIQVSFIANKDKSETKYFPGNLLKLRLELQACNNQKCLAPEKVNLTISA